MSDPYYAFYPGDYLRDTQDLSLSEHGAYFMMLNHYYCYSTLPSDKERLYRICKALTDEEKESIDAVRERYFTDNGNGKLINKRAEKEIDKRKGFLKEQSRKGKKSAEKKWGPQAQIDGEDFHKKRSERLSEARKKGTHTEIEWMELVKICGNNCVKCKTNDSFLLGGKLLKDHIVPIYQGGSDSIDNLQPMCRNCNAAKHNEIADFRPKDWENRLTERLTERLT